MTRHAISASLIAVTLMLGGAICLLPTSSAAPPNAVPLGNSVEQRIEMIGYLKEMVSQMREQNKLLREQNDLLKSGKLKVIVEPQR